MSLENVLSRLESNENRFINLSNQYGQEALRLAEKESKNRIDSISEFSNTLSEELVRRKKLENERLEKEGKIDAIEEEMDRYEKDGSTGVSIEEKNNYYAGVEQLKEIKTAFDSASLEVLDQGGSFTESKQVKEMSGFRLYGHVKQKAISAGENYKDWMEGQMLNNEDIEITYRGRTFTPNKAESLAEKSVAMKALRRKYLDERGLLGVNRILLGDHFYDKALSAHREIMSGYEEQEAIEDGFITEEQARKEFSADKDFVSYISTMASTKDKDGNLRHRRGALDLAFKMMKDEADIGRLSMTDLKKIEDQEIMINGKSVRIGDHWEGRFLKFREQLADENRTNWEADKAERKVKAEQLEEKGIQWILDNIDKATPQDFRHIREKVANFGYKTERLDRIEETLGATALANNDMEAKFKSLFEMNLLTAEMVKNAPAKLQAKWVPLAVQQDKLRSKSSGYKKELKSLEEEIKLKVKTRPDGDLGATPTLVAKELQQIFLKKAWNYHQLEIDSPVERALLETKKHYLENGGDGKDENGRYYVSKGLGQLGKFKNFEDAIYSKNKDRNQSIIQREIDISKAVIDKGLQKVLTSAEDMFTKAEAESWGEGYGQPGWEVSPLVQYYHRKYSIPVFEIINKQREAHGLTELKPPDHYRQVIEKVDPALRSLMSSNSYSPNQSARVLSSTGEFIPGLIPEEKGEVVEKAAAENNVDPGILAGYIEISPMNWTATEEDIDQFAFTLGTLQEVFQGNTEASLMAISPELNLGDLYKSASKYGFTEAWSNPATWRSSIRDK